MFFVNELDTLLLLDEVEVTVEVEGLVETEDLGTEVEEEDLEGRVGLVDDLEEGLVEVEVVVVVVVVVVDLVTVDLGIVDVTVRGTVFEVVDDTCGVDTDLLWVTLTFLDGVTIEFVVFDPLPPHFTDTLIPASFLFAFASYY